MTLYQDIAVIGVALAIFGGLGIAVWGAWQVFMTYGFLGVSVAAFVVGVVLVVGALMADS